MGPFHIIAPYEDVYVLTDVSLIREYAVAESVVTFPERIEHVAKRREVSGQAHFQFSAGVGFEMTAEVNGYGH